MVRQIVTCIALLVALVASPVTAETVAVVTHGQDGDTFWDVVKQGVMDASEETGVTVAYSSPATFDMAEMSALIDKQVDAGVDGLVVSLPNADALGAAVERAVAAGIPVISINSGSDEAQYLGVKLHVGQNEFFAGRTAGEKMTAMGKTRAICINQEVGNIALDLRCAGFAQGFAGQVHMLSTTLDKEETVAIIRAALRQDPAIDSILTLGADSVAMPAVAALEAEGLSDRITVGTFDVSTSLLNAVVDGKVAFGIDQQQYFQGYLPIRLFKSYFDAGSFPEYDVTTGGKLVEATEAAELLKK